MSLRQPGQSDEEGKSQEAAGRPAPPPDGLGLRHKVPEVVGKQPGAQFTGKVPELELVLVNPADVSHRGTRRSAAQEKNNSTRLHIVASTSALTNCRSEGVLQRLYIELSALHCKMPVVVRKEKRKCAWMCFFFFCQRRTSFKSIYAFFVFVSQLGIVALITL